jgi:small subunit ribosomal protein S4
MKLGPKYKICRRIGDRVFGKCEDPKFDLTPPARKGKHGGRRAKSEFGTQLLEKQKVRFTYGVSERQFAGYIEKVSSKHGINPSELLYEMLERRLDNVVYRTGLVTSRAHARQLVSHGHVLVDGKKVNIPSYQVRPGEKVRIKDRSKASPMFASIEERLKTYTHPEWMMFDEKNFEATIKGVPHVSTSAVPYNLTSVIEFYSR